MRDAIIIFFAILVISNTTSYLIGGVDGAIRVANGTVVCDPVERYPFWYCKEANHGEN
jgi:hypothetical protein